MDTNFPYKKYLTVEEVAAILKIKRNTVQSKRWQKSTGCEFDKVGKRNYIEENKFYSVFRRN